MPAVSRCCPRLMLSFHMAPVNWGCSGTVIPIGKLSCNKPFKHMPQGREEILAPATERSDINLSIWMESARDKIFKNEFLIELFPTQFSFYFGLLKFFMNEPWLPLIKYFILDNNVVKHFNLLLRCLCLQQLFLLTHFFFFNLVPNSKRQITMDSTQGIFS